MIRSNADSWPGKTTLEEGKQYYIQQVGFGFFYVDNPSNNCHLLIITNLSGQPDATDFLEWAKESKYSVITYWQAVSYQLKQEWLEKWGFKKVGDVIIARRTKNKLQEWRLML